MTAARQPAGLAHGDDPPAAERRPAAPVVPAVPGEALAESDLLDAAAPPALARAAVRDPQAAAAEEGEEEPDVETAGELEVLLERGLSALGEMAEDGGLAQRLAMAPSLDDVARPPLGGGATWLDPGAQFDPLDASVPVSGVIVPVAASLPSVFGSGSTGGLATFGRLFGDQLARDDFYRLLQGVFEADFDVDEDGFTYADDAFRGTAQPAYADGLRIGAGGFSGGALQVTLGSVDNSDILGLSGGWQYQLTLAEAREVTVTFRYRLSHSSEYEADEYGEALLSVDGTLYGSGVNDYIARLSGDGNGGPDHTTGWQSFTVDLGVLAAGLHSVVVGGYVNKKTYGDEWTEVLVDDLSITTGDPLAADAASGVLANDVAQNGLALSALLETGPSNGSLDLAADGSFSYTPDVGFTGTDSFTYRAFDGVAFDSATVLLEVL